MATSYANPGGSGNRTPTLVQVTVTGTPAIGINTVLGAAVDGATSTNAFFFGAGSAYTVEFWFASKKIIDEAKMYQSSATAHGTWKWQGSNDRTSWTDIGGTFTLGGVTTQTMTTLAGNTTGYIFYRLFQVTGPASGSPWIYEFEFKIDEAGTTSYTHARGSGDRTATITTAIGGGLTWGAGSAANLINGSLANEAFWSAGAAAGSWISFDLGASYLVQEARVFISAAVSDQGTWKLQGSPNNSTWIDLSGPVVLGAAVGGAGSLTYVGGFANNTTDYRYYRLLGVSGNRTTNPYELEIEFMAGPPLPPPVVAPTLTDALDLRGTTDENGALRAVVDTTGTVTGPLTSYGNVRLRTDATGALVVASGTAGAQSGPLTVFPNLRGRVNDAGALLVASASAGAARSPLTALGTLRLRTDENGALKVAAATAGSVIGPLTPLANLRVRTDENGALLMAGLAVETYSSRVLADGAFAYWRFVETTGPVLDSAGAFNGTISGTVTRGVAGAILSAPSDFAISVAGAGRIDLPIMTLPAICSVEVWVKTPVSSGFHMIWTNRNGTVSTNPTFLMENGQPQFAMNGITVSPPVFRVDDGLWHHVVGTASGTDLSIYVDGVFKHSIANATTASAAQPGVIGWDNFSGFSTLTIDNLALYPIALTATQVANHYHLAGY